MYYSGGGGKPAPLAAFSCIGLLKDLNFPQNSPHKKPAFTLAEVGFSVGCSDSETRNIRSSVEGGKISERNLKPAQEQNSRIIRYKWAFTLAEVLITLAIIGIVAALTIPSLMNKINSKVVENQKKVMTGKIVQGLNLLNSQESGLTKSYANSEEFVRALSKYMKMTTICGAGNLKDCFAYDKVNYDKDGEVKSVELSSITSASKLKLDNSFLAPAGFVMGDGTPVIVAWNSKCASGAQDATILDPDQPLKGIPTTCFDGIYDNSGTRNPNMYGKDVLPFGAAKIGTSYPGVEIPGIGYVYNIGTNYSRIDTCNDSTYDDRKTSYCRYNAWAGAKKACADLGMELPNKETLYSIYNKKNSYPELPESGVFWSSSENDADTARRVVFSDGDTFSGAKTDLCEVLCVGK